MKKRYAALTFDDGPHAEYTPEILDLLRRHRVKGTFFLVGNASQRHPELVRRIHAEGHDIGNHTFSHPVSPFLKTDRRRFIREEIERTNRVIKRIVGRRPVLFRSTLAFWDLSVRDLLRQARECGHLPVGWTLSTRDWLGNRFLIRSTFRKNCSLTRDIVLLHDGAQKTMVRNRQPTIEILPELIEHYRRSSYQLISLTDMLL